MPGDADVVERVLDVVELERLDDRLDLLHAVPSLDRLHSLMPNRRRIWKAGARANESDHPFRRPGLAPRPSGRRPAQVPDRLQRAEPARPPARHARGERRARGGGGHRISRRAGQQAIARRSGGPAVRTIFNPFYKVADNTGSLFMAREELSGDCLVWNGDTLVSRALMRARRRQRPQRDLRHDRPQGRL